MENFNFYEIAKIIHIISFVAWFAGLFYLPRLFVYHCQVDKIDKAYDLLATMERKLLRYIMNPAMICTILSGSYLIYQISFAHGWLHAKLTFVVILVIFHHALAKYRKNFANHANNKSEKFYRIINEVPTLLLIIIVTLAIAKPF